MSDIVPGPYRPLDSTLIERQREIERVEEISGGVFRVCGTISFAGAGEVVSWVNPLPVVFLERPAYSFGGELEPSSPISNGHFPTVSGVIKDWQYQTRPDSGQRLRTGCSFLIVVTGLHDQLFIFHYQLEGRALRPPIPTS